MAAGEFPVTLITPNLQLTVTSTLVVGVNNSVLSVPSTPSQIEQGVIPSKVTLGPKGLTLCPNIGSYTQLSVLQWSTNPYANSKAIRSQLLRFSTTSQTSGNAARRRLTSSSNTYTLKGVPAYTLTIQYSTPQNFNFDAGLDYTTTGKSKSNYTIPACTKYDGKRYVSCNGCDILSYTNYNVTYSCYDISQICPSSVVRRSLLERSSSVDEEEIVEVEEEETDNYEGSHSSDSEDETRFLAGNDDDTGSTGVPSTYGVLIRSIVGEVSAVLSSNPFTLNLGKSKTVLIFVGCLSGFIFLMLMYLLRRDNKERILKTYVKTTNDTKARVLLEEDIKNGRKGDHSMLYQSHITDIKRDCNRSTGVMSYLQRTARGGYGLGTLKRLRRRITMQPVHPMYLKTLNSGSDNGFDSDSESDDENDSESVRESHTDSNKNSEAKEITVHETEAAITEFLHRLFPGNGIFKKRTNATVILAANHDYFKMFGGSTMTRTRTIRFLELVALVLVTLFVDTLFFGIFYPANTCNKNIDKVHHIIFDILPLDALYHIMWPNYYSYPKMSVSPCPAYAALPCHFPPYPAFKFPASLSRSIYQVLYSFPSASIYLFFQLFQVFHFTCVHFSLYPRSTNFYKIS